MYSTRDSRAEKATANEAKRGDDKLLSRNSSKAQIDKHRDEDKNAPAAAVNVDTF